jgi:hypothetical protein
MKITKFEYIKTLRPNMSCGTGYSEPDKFHITCNTGYETDIWIDIWYLTEDSAEKEFVETLKREFDNVENIPEAFELYKNALRTSSSCPYYWSKK